MTASDVRVPSKEIRPRILLIEPDGAAAAALLQAVELAGFSATWASTGAEAVSQKAALRPHVVLMDLAVPDMSGLALLAQLAGARDCGIIVITDMADEADRIVGLELGADDYMAKPPGLRELVARIRAVHRRASEAAEVRSTPQAGGGLTIGPIQVNIKHRTVHTVAGQRLVLTSAEFSALQALVNAAGAPVSRDNLSKAALRRPWRAEDRSVDQLMFSLRRKLPADENGEMLIQCIRSTGYWIRPPDGMATPVLAHAATTRHCEVAA